VCDDEREEHYRSDRDHGELDEQLEEKPQHEHKQETAAAKDTQAVLVQKQVHQAGYRS
jgi:hypothetical protein